MTYGVTSHPRQASTVPLCVPIDRLQCEQCSCNSPHTAKPPSALKAGTRDKAHACACFSTARHLHGQRPCTQSRHARRARARARAPVKARADAAQQVLRVAAGPDRGLHYALPLLQRRAVVRRNRLLQHRGGIAFACLRHQGWHYSGVSTHTTCHCDICYCESLRGRPPPLPQSPRRGRRVVAAATPPLLPSANRGAGVRRAALFLGPAWLLPPLPVSPLQHRPLRHPPFRLLASQYWRRHKLSSSGCARSSTTAVCSQPVCHRLRSDLVSLVRWWRSQATEGTKTSPELRA